MGKGGVRTVLASNQKGRRSPKTFGLRRPTTRICHCGSMLPNAEAQLRIENSLRRLPNAE